MDLRSMAMSTLEMLPWTVVLLGSFAAACTDVRSQRIPNALTAPLLLAGLAWAMLHAGWAGAGSALAGGAALALPFVLLFLFAGGGAGDAKLMAALGVWLGLGQGMVALAAVAVWGAVLAVGFAVARGRTRVLASNLAAMGMTLALVRCRAAALGDVAAIPSAAARATTMPYALAIFMGMGSAGLWCYLRAA